VVAERRHKVSAATGTIRKRGKHYYIRTRVRVIDPETNKPGWKQVEKAAGTNRKQASEALKALQKEVDEDTFIPTSMTVLELGRKWLKEHVQPELKPGAAANYKSTFNRHVAPSLGHLRLDACKQEVVDKLLAEKRAAGLSAETVAKIRRHMHAMFAFGQDKKLLTVNPCAQPRRRGRKQRRKARGIVLTPMQIGRFLEECSPRWRRFFTVALDTGLRRGEMIGLRREDVALLERVLYVRRSIGVYDDPEELEDDEDELDTKTEAGERVVPILDGAQVVLEEVLAEAEDTRDEAPVFATIERKRARERGPDGRLRPTGPLLPTGRPLSPRMVTRVYRRYADRAGIPKKIRLHDMRHTLITNAINQGEDILIVAMFAGHAKTSTTLDVYGHQDPKRAREAAKRMRSVAQPDSSHTFSHTLPTNVADQRPAGILVEG
jgi:integrase